MSIVARHRVPLCARRVVSVAVASPTVTGRKDSSCEPRGDPPCPQLVTGQGKERVTLLSENVI